MTTFEFDIIELPFSEIRINALNFLQQAYETEPNEFQARARANRLEELIMQQIQILIDDANGEVNSAIEETYINKVVALGLHLAQTTQTGFYALSLNNYLRQTCFYELPTMLFPELHINTTLSDQERFTLKQNHQLEYMALKEAFQLGQYCQNSQYFRNIEDFDLADTECTDLYSECYNRLMCAEGHCIQSYSCPPFTQLFVEITQNNHAVFEISTKHLLWTILTDKINPATGFKYDMATIQKVRQKFFKELKLIQLNLSELGRNVSA